jgi:hypothetical protein
MFNIISNITNEKIYERVNLIFFVHPDPKGSEENQFTPLGAGVNKLIFERIYYHNPASASEGSPSLFLQLTKIEMRCKISLATGLVHNF